MYVFLFVLIIVTTVAFQGWRTLLNNFAVEVGGLDGVHMGIVQSVREIPGFFALFAVYLLLIFREHRLAAVSTMILGAGVAATGFFPSTFGIACTTLIMSFGFHYYQTVNQSLTLQYFDKTEAPIVMGRLQSITALTNITVGGIVYVVARWLDYSQLFALVGGVAVVGGLWAYFRDPSCKEIPIQRKEMVFRARYWLFYVLTFLAGARRQVFVAFAVFLLVQKFGFTIEQVTALFVLNNVVNYFANPIIARAVNRIGERKVLSLEYATLVIVFCAYALTDNPWLAAGLYVVDNIMFNFSMAIRTFYQKIADSGDIASGMAVGFTINHIAAVAVPFMGGVAWMSDYRIVFYGAAGLSALSLIFTQFIDWQLNKAVVRD